MMVQWLKQNTGLFFKINLNGGNLQAYVFPHIVIYMKQCGDDSFLSYIGWNIATVDSSFIIINQHKYSIVADLMRIAILISDSESLTI